MWITKLSKLRTRHKITHTESRSSVDMMTYAWERKVMNCPFDSRLTMLALPHDIENAYYNVLKTKAKIQPIWMKAKTAHYVKKDNNNSWKNEVVTAKQNNVLSWCTQIRKGNNKENISITRVTPLLYTELKNFSCTLYIFQSKGVFDWIYTALHFNIVRSEFECTFASTYIQPSFGLSCIICMTICDNIEIMVWCSQ